MRADFSPLQMLLVTLAGWVNRHQQRVIEYLVEENRVLKEQVMAGRLRLTDDQRRRLAAKGRRLVLSQVATDHEGDRVAHSAHGHGESGLGLHAHPGALKNLGPGVARSTVAKVLRANGISPAPDRPSSWRTFLRAHWGAIAGADFFTSEVWTPRGLVTYSTLFVIDLRSRRCTWRARPPTRMPGSWRRPRVA
jgi:hypothetical protein